MRKIALYLLVLCLVFTAWGCVEGEIGAGGEDEQLAFIPAGGGEPVILPTNEDGEVDWIPPEEEGELVYVPAETEDELGTEDAGDAPVGGGGGDDIKLYTNNHGRAWGATRIDRGTSFVRNGRRYYRVRNVTVRLVRGHLWGGTPANRALMLAMPGARATDQAGHGVGQQMGGRARVGDAIPIRAHGQYPAGFAANVFPQWGHMNMGAFAQYENAIVNLVNQQGGQATTDVLIFIEFTYPNNWTFRPNRIDYNVAMPWDWPQVHLNTLQHFRAQTGGHLTTLPVGNNTTMRAGGNGRVWAVCRTFWQ